jgi:hypothetical protein
LLMERFHFPNFGEAIEWFHKVLSFGKVEKAGFMIASYMSAMMMNGILLAYRPD